MNDLRRKGSQDKNEGKTSSDSDIFVILGISASLIVLILIVSLIILPKFRK